ncbi:helix-turn-helix transcriptional regulator [Caballeronia mineralivorans]|uniref:helix-turn-helix transcriptional regulator n=1 Tax=Caballeronia mineralivorans TaxID=2010198 RepID=UPI0022859633|nr:AlpA family phage regulatory protein [Caballeronia mineralivorans]
MFRSISANHITTSRDHYNYFETSNCPSYGPCRNAWEVPGSRGRNRKSIRERNFPQPRMLSGRRVGWLLREVEAWAEARPVLDLPPPPDSGKRRPKDM